MTDEDATIILEQLLKDKRFYWVSPAGRVNNYSCIDPTINYNIQRLVIDIKYLEEHKRKWWIA